MTLQRGPVSPTVTIFGQIPLAWLVGCPRSSLSGEVDEDWTALIFASGLLLVGAGIGMLVGDRKWRQLVAHVARRGAAYRTTRIGRIWIGTLRTIIGLGWAFMGATGVLHVAGIVSSD